jgi:hypothetical protein
MILAAILLQAAVAPQMPSTPLPTVDAVATFRRLCVATMPDPQSFATALDAERGRWTAFEKIDGEVTILGHFWRSELGEVSYVNLPDATFLETNPACHFSFRTGPDYRHGEAAALLAGALSLGAGKQIAKKRSPQTRWEARLPNGTRVRIFLSSAVYGMDGPAATLSVSAYRQARRDR